MKYTIDQFHIWLKDFEEMNKFKIELEALCNKYSDKHFFNFRLPTKNAFERLAEDLSKVRNEISRSGVDHYEEMTFNDEDQLFQLECKLQKMSKKYRGT